MSPESTFRLTSGGTVTSKLNLDPEVIGCCRESAGALADQVLGFASQRTTVSIERATLRLMGVEGADGNGVPRSIAWWTD
jgi:beta-lysine 5,6-aminomutase alpha subunit